MSNWLKKQKISFLFFPFEGRDELFFKYLVSLLALVHLSLKTRLYYIPLAGPDPEIVNKPLSSECLNGLTAIVAVGGRRHFI